MRNMATGFGLRHAECRGMDSRTGACPTIHEAVSCSIRKCIEAQFNISERPDMRVYRDLLYRWALLCPVARHLSYSPTSTSSSCVLRSGLTTCAIASHQSWSPEAGHNHPSTYTRACKAPSSSSRMSMRWTPLNSRCFTVDATHGMPAMPATLATGSRSITASYHTHRPNNPSQTPTRAITHSPVRAHLNDSAAVVLIPSCRSQLRYGVIELYAIVQQPAGVPRARQLAGGHVFVRRALKLHSIRQSAPRLPCLADRLWAVPAAAGQLSTDICAAPARVRPEREL